MRELDVLKRLVGLRNVGLHAHNHRVGQYAAFLCDCLELDPNLATAIGHACSLHDLGKVVLPNSVLLKPTALTSGEWSIMRNHSALGHEILQNDTDPVMKLSASVALTHHKSFDGSGYPHGLRQFEIPLEGRIASICDVYDALREDRVYRPGLTHEAAMHIMMKGDGQTSPSQFDPDLLRVFASGHQRYAELFKGFSTTPSPQPALGDRSQKLPAA